MAGVTVCPAAVVAVSPERVWSILGRPERYGEWIDATVVRVDPPGGPAPGQVVHAVTRGFGRSWNVSITVELVDESRHEIFLQTALPLGIVVRNHITAAPLGNGDTTRVQFG